MLLKLLKKIFPKTEEDQQDVKINETTKKAWVELERYKDASQALQEEIDRNHFSPLLIYDKNKKDKVIEKIKKGEEGK